MLLGHRGHWVLHAALVRDGEHANHLMAVGHHALEDLGREGGLAEDGHLQLVPGHAGAEVEAALEEVGAADEGGGGESLELRRLFHNYQGFVYTVLYLHIFKHRY